MFITLMAILAVAYVFLKISNTRAKFAEYDARKAAEEEAARQEAEEAAEEELVRAEAIDVDAETIAADSGVGDYAEDRDPGEPGD